MASFRFFMAALFCAALFAPSFISAARAEEGLYSGVITDLPVMKEMRELSNRAVIFDALDGRLLETAFEADLTPAQITNFYNKTLPALGWHEEEGAAWRREGEILRLHYETPGDKTPRRTLVIFNLSPFVNTKP